MNETDEVLRYLGYRGNRADNRTLQKIDSCMEELNRSVSPKSISRTVSLTFSDGALLLNKLKIESSDLKKHIKGCEKAVIFAATLGAKADFLLERTTKTDIAKAVILQSCAAVKIESYCDNFQNNLAEKVKSDGLFLKPRYSPGYGNFSIRHQQDILKILDCQKRIGLSMTDDFMLVPTKSVTAVIGLTKDNKECQISKCKNCKSKNCPFRKE